jgi:hypothetical protein
MNSNKEQVEKLLVELREILSKNNARLIVSIDHDIGIDLISSKTQPIYFPTIDKDTKFDDHT